MQMMQLTDIFGDDVRDDVVVGGVAGLRGSEGTRRVDQHAAAVSFGVLRKTSLNGKGEARYLSSENFAVFLIRLTGAVVVDEWEFDGDGAVRPAHRCCSPSFLDIGQGLEDSRCHGAWQRHNTLCDIQIGQDR